MPDRPLRCASCGNTDFFVISNGVAYRGGTIIEMYRWPERQDELDDSADLEEHLTHSAHGQGYVVEQEVLREPDIEAVEGPVKAICAGCLADITDNYMQLGRAESLPV